MNPALGTSTSKVDTHSPTGGEHVDSSTDPIFELLEQNASWWEQAALTCERIAANHGLGTREEWQLMGAVYRERAQRHMQVIDQLRLNVKGISSRR
jgi:hypothetical protein